jgi:hypothetical protein
MANCIDHIDIHTCEHWTVLKTHHECDGDNCKSIRQVVRYMSSACYNCRRAIEKEVEAGLVAKSKSSHIRKDSDFCEMSRIK